MGYCMWQRDCQDFFIPKEKLHDATLALNEFSQKEQSFEEHLLEAGFETEKDGDGNVIGLYFTGEKLTDQYEMFQALLPFVKEGAFLEFIGEEFDQWRWVFRKGKLIEITPTIVWDMEESQ